MEPPYPSPPSASSSSRFTSALIAGACAGTAVDTLFFPIDTLKTRAQSAQGFFAAGGFSGVYRGLGSAVVGSAPGASLFFTSYELAKHHLPRFAPFLGSDSGAPLLHMLSASSGEVAACLVRVPTEVVKQRAQTAAASSSLDVARRVWAQEGLRGFYRGFGSTVAREIPFTCLQFPLYERLKLLLAQRTVPSQRVSDLPAHHAAACGSLAGGVAAGLTTPLDVCKTRIMLRAKDAAGAGDGILGTMRGIYAAEGAGALFRGVVPRVVWISAGGAVFLGVYEAVKGALAGEQRAGEGRERRD
ncbi:S-adenosylmethionine transporter [Rhodotorula kratochvilovae]